MADSMPSPSRSNLTSPTEAQSSLSHCRTVRFGMRAHSTGHTSITGRSQITMPPEWMPRCRGNCCRWLANVMTSGGISSYSTWAKEPQRSICLLQASCCPGECPSALAMSRTAAFAKAFGHSPGQQDAWSKQIDRWGSFAHVEYDEIPPEVITFANHLQQFPRHLGIHSGGMVICDRPVIEVCPVEWARMPNRTVLQWDKDDCASVGLVKFDLLGLGLLSAIRY